MRSMSIRQLSTGKMNYKVNNYIFILYFNTFNAVRMQLSRHIYPLNCFTDFIEDFDTSSDICAGGGIFARSDINHSIGSISMTNNKRSVKELVEYCNEGDMDVD